MESPWQNNLGTSQPRRLKSAMIAEITNTIHILPIGL